MDDEQYHLLKAKYADCTHSNYCRKRNAERIMEYMENIAVALDKLRELLKMHISSDNQDYKLIMRILEDINEQSYVTCVEAQMC